jgi:hypothetical protein
VGAFLAVAAAVGRSRADVSPAAPGGQVTQPGRAGQAGSGGYDGFFAYSFDITHRSHEVSGQEAAFTQQAYRLSARFDYFGKDNPSALGSVPGVEGVLSVGWAGGASYSGMAADGLGPVKGQSGGFLFDFDLIANWTVLNASSVVWQVGPRLSFDLDSGLRDVGELSLGASACTRLFYRASESLWARLEFDHLLADFVYERHDQLRLMVALGKYAVVGAGGTGKTLGSGFREIGVSFAVMN